MRNPTYPSLSIYVTGILQNLDIVKAIVENHDISLSVVTKGLVGYKPLVSELCNEGVNSICESRIQNLEQFADIDVEKWLIRLPLISEAEDVVRFSDISLNSEIDTIMALNYEAARQEKIHKVVVMAELGELREGADREEILRICRACEDMENIELYGIGANMGCFSEIIPDENNMNELVRIVELVEQSLGIKIPVISAGSSNTLPLLVSGKLNGRINHLRIGEAILLGNIPCFDTPLSDAVENAKIELPKPYRPSTAPENTFTLHAEIIEIKEKATRPTGKRAPNAPNIDDEDIFSDRGIRRRALIALGKQDVHAGDFVPMEPGMKILGDTSDCFVADIEDCRSDLKVGDSINLRLKYNGFVSAMASSYIDKMMCWIRG